MIYATIFTVVLLKFASGTYFGDVRNIYTATNQNLSAQCVVQMNQLLQNLQDENSNDFWALKMIDSSGKLPSGLLRGNFGEMGNFKQCISIKHWNNTIEIDGNYCLGSLQQLVLSNNVSNQAGLPLTFFLLGGENSPVNIAPYLAICLPSGCNENDAQILLQDFFASFNVSLDLAFKCQTANDLHQEWTVQALICIFIFVFVVVLMILSTIYDVLCRNYNSKPRHFLFVVFSVYTNGMKLFTMNSSEIPCLDGIRVLSMMWVVLGHNYVITIMSPSSNLLDTIDFFNSTESMFFVNAVHTVDTFLVVTGFLVVYGYMKAMNRGIKFNIAWYYFHRYLRLTPALAALLLVTATVIKYFGSGPHWHLTEGYLQSSCVKYWWTTLLYVQNYVNQSEFCITHSWYLNVDMQLYLISPIFLLLLTKSPKIGVSFLLLGMSFSMGFSFYLTWIKQLPGIQSNFNGNIVGYVTYYYYKTHTRAAPWFIGGILGYIVARIKFEKAVFKINKILNLILWSLAIALLSTCVFAGHDTLYAKEYDKWDNALYNSCVRPAWAVGISWIILACTTNNGGICNWMLSLPIFGVLNRFTYSVYLLHLMILYLITFAKKSSTYVTIFDIMYSFWGIVALSFGLSIFWVLAFESPINAIQKHLMAKSK